MIFCGNRVFRCLIYNFSVATIITYDVMTRNVTDYQKRITDSSLETETKRCQNMDSRLLSFQVFMFGIYFKGFQKDCIAKRKYTSRLPERSNYIKNVVPK